MDGHFLGDVINRVQQSDLEKADEKFKKDAETNRLLRLNQHPGTYSASELIAAYVKETGDLPEVPLPEKQKETGIEVDNSKQLNHFPPPPQG